MFQQGEDPIECINKAMAFLSTLASRFPPSNNQLRTSSNPRNQETIQDGRVIVQQVQDAVIQDTNPSTPNDLLMLAEAQKAGQILDEEQLAFLADLGISEALAKAVLMANLSSCDPEVHSEVPYSDSYPNDMINQDYLQKTQDAVIQDTTPSASNDLLVISLVEQMTNHVADLDKENQTNKMSLTKNKGKTSSEVEPDTQTLLLITDADVQAPLLSIMRILLKRKMMCCGCQSLKASVSYSHKEQPESSHAKDTYAYDSESSSCSETFRPYDNFVPIIERVFVQNLQHILEVLYAQVIEDNWTKHEEDSASYADLKASIEEYYKENVDHKAQTDKLVYEIMSNLDKISKAGVDVRAKLMKSLNKVSETLKSDSDSQGRKKNMNKDG
ncbi:hypothetical protein Tco_0038457 [Tanacetum coccineum]